MATFEGWFGNTVFQMTFYIFKGTVTFLGLWSDWDVFCLCDGPLHWFYIARFDLLFRWQDDLFKNNST